MNIAQHGSNKELRPSEESTQSLDNMRWPDRIIGFSLLPKQFPSMIAVVEPGFLFPSSHRLLSTSRSYL